MKRSLLLPWIRSWSRRSYILHGILIAQMILLPCSSSNGVWVDVDLDGDGVFDTGYDDGASTPNDPDPLPPDPIDPEPPLPPSGDADGDGLNNADESAAGSNPYNPDSDYDGLTDSVETNLTGTDPTSTDSSGDGISDYNDFYGNTSVDTDTVGAGDSPYDHDGDGIHDPVDPDPLSPTNDPDSDGDYVPDSQDTDPSDPTEWSDDNNNGTNDDAEIPNNDTDGDGISNDTDSHPTDPYLSNDWNYNSSNDQDEDWDGDGVSNLQDSHPNTNCQWCDWNGNGVNDDSESGNADSDGDGYSDNSDSHSYNSSLWEDWNGNGTNDSQESQNNDGDGYPDGSDSDPYNSSLWDDWNRNGTNDSQESQDSDGDGYADGSDSDPFNNSLWEDWNRNGTNDSQEPPPVTDRDGDGYNDNSDSDPDYNGLWSDWNRNGTNDENEPPPQDSDGDGYQDDSDSDPANSNLWEDGNRNGYNDSNEHLFIDSDQDGHVDAFDTHPNDSSLWNDQNANGQNDDTETVLVDTDADGYADSLDTHPSDPQRWNDHNNNGSNDELDVPPDIDGDGLPDSSDPSPADSDNDGVTNTTEVLSGTNPTNADTDGDGSPDGVEQLTGTNPSNVDSDGDGLTDNEEQQVYFTDPLVPTSFASPPDNPPENDSSIQASLPSADDPAPADQTPPAADPAAVAEIVVSILEQETPGSGLNEAEILSSGMAANFPSISSDGSLKRDLKKRFFVQNVGDADLVLQPVTRVGSGEFAISAYSPNTTILPPGASVSFTVSFSALAAFKTVSQTAVITIPSNDPNFSLFNVNLASIVPTGIWQTHGAYFSADLRDRNEDGIPDRVADMYLPRIVTATGDLDGDGVTNLAQYRLGFDLLRNTSSADFDNDGLENELEDAWGKVYSQSKYNFADAYADPDGDGLLTIEELKLTWGTRNLKDPRAVATNPFLTSTGPNISAVPTSTTPAAIAAATNKLTFNTPTRTPPSIKTPANHWNVREAGANYAAWMNDGLLRKACRENVNSTTQTLPADFFNQTNLQVYQPVIGSDPTNVSSYDHIPLGYWKWLSRKNVPQPAAGGLSSGPSSASQNIINDHRLPSNNSETSDADLDLMPNQWEAAYGLNWRDSTDASLPKIKATIIAYADKVTLSVAERDRLNGVTLAALMVDKTSALITLTLKDGTTRQTNLINSYPVAKKVPTALAARPASTATPAAKADWEKKRGIWETEFTLFHAWPYLDKIDPDHDGLVNADEYALGLDPTLADYAGTGNERDTDGDGFTDAQELLAGTDSKVASSKPVLTLKVISGANQSGRPFATLTDPIIIQSVYQGPKGGFAPAPGTTVTIKALNNSVTNKAPNNYTLLAAHTSDQKPGSLPKAQWSPGTIAETLVTDDQGKLYIGVKLPYVKGLVSLNLTGTKAALKATPITTKVSVIPDPADTDGDGMPNAWETQAALTTPLILPAHGLNATSALDAEASPLYYLYHRDTPLGRLPANIVSELAVLRKDGRLVDPASLNSISGLTAARKTFLQNILKQIDPDNDGLSNLEEYAQRDTGLTHPQIGRKPHITVQPKGHATLVGSMATFSVRAVTGDGRNPIFKYRWKATSYQFNERNAVLALQQLIVSDQSEISFLVPEVASGFTFHYWVEVSNSELSTASDKAAWIATEPLEIYGQTTGVVVNSGDPDDVFYTYSVSNGIAKRESLTDGYFNVSCKGGNFFNLLSFQWFSGESGDTSTPVEPAPVEEDWNWWYTSNLYRSDVWPSRFKPTLIMKDGVYKYWVRVNSEFGHTVDSSTMTLTLVRGLLIVSQPRSQKIRQLPGQAPPSVLLKVSVLNAENSTFQWRRVTYSPAYPRGSSSDVRGATELHLQTPPLANDIFDSPTNRFFHYKLLIMEPSGLSHFSDVATIELIRTESVPIIEVEPEDNYTRLKSGGFEFSVIASGEVEGSPGTELKYQWYLGKAGNTASPIKGANQKKYAVAVSSTSPPSIWVKVSNSSGQDISRTVPVDKIIALANQKKKGPSLEPNPPFELHWNNPLTLTKISNKRIPVDDRKGNVKNYDSSYGSRTHYARAGNLLKTSFISPSVTLRSAVTLAEESLFPDQVMFAEYSFLDQNKSDTGGPGDLERSKSSNEIIMYHYKSNYNKGQTPLSEQDETQFFIETRPQIMAKKPGSMDDNEFPIKLPQGARQSFVVVKTTAKESPLRPIVEFKEVCELVIEPESEMSLPIELSPELINEMNQPPPNMETADIKYSLLPVEIEWNAPLEEWKDVSGRENEAGRYTSITVKAPAPLNTIEKLREMGLKLRMFSKANKLSGTPVNVDLFDEADFLYNTNGGNVIATFKPDTLERIGILLANERDNINEFATCDTALPTDTSSNWTDSDNFASNILAYGYHERGKARGEGNGGLPGTRPNNFTEYGKLEAKANNQFLKQGGVDFIRFELTKDGATVAASETRQIRDQADWFYYSGHGHHNNAKLMTLDEEIGPGDVKWNKDMDVAIIAGCSVLDIKDYRAQSFGVLKYAEWLGKGGAWSPGAQWEPTGPKYILGYCYSAPLDTQGAATIASHFSGLIQSGHSIQDAWKSANDNANGRNACLINLNTSPPTYSYWDETSGSPVWTTVSKGATGW